MSEELILKAFGKKMYRLRIELQLSQNRWLSELNLIGHMLVLLSADRETSAF